MCINLCGGTSEAGEQEGTGRLSRPFLNLTGAARVPVSDKELTMSKMLRSFAALAGLMVVVGLVGCDSDNDSNPLAPNVPQTGNVKVVHASPDAPAVDLLVDNVAAGTGLAFPNNTGYLAVPSGVRNFKVNVAGTATTVIEADLPITAGTNTSVFAVNAVANLEPLVLSDDLTTPAAGKAHVRFIHLSPDAPSVDVALQGGAVVFGNKAFKEFTAFTPLDAGTYDLEVRLAGTSTVVLPLPGIALQAGKIYTVFAKGFVSGSGAQALGAQIIVNN
jgi:hypothetical protein